MKFESLSKDAKKCMFVATAINSLILAAILGGTYYFVMPVIPDNYNTLINISLIIIGVLLIVNLIIAPSFRYKRYKYLINKEKIDVIEGYVWIKRVIVPVSRIHKITLQRGPIDTIFGLSKVIITTAGGEAVIRFLKVEKAEYIADRLKDKVNELIEE